MTVTIVFKILKPVAAQPKAFDQYHSNTLPLIPSHQGRGKHTHSAGSTKKIEFEVIIPSPLVGEG